MFSRRVQGEEMNEELTLNAEQRERMGLRLYGRSKALAAKYLCTLEACGCGNDIVISEHERKNRCSK